VPSTCRFNSAPSDCRFEGPVGNVVSSTCLCTSLRRRRRGFATLPLGAFDRPPLANTLVRALAIARSSSPWELVVQHRPPPTTIMSHDMPEQSDTWYLTAIGILDSFRDTGRPGIRRCGRDYRRCRGGDGPSSRHTWYVTAVGILDSFRDTGRPGIRRGGRDYGRCRGGDGATQQVPKTKVGWGGIGWGGVTPPFAAWLL
jgi:hypothetical protein